ncbi:PCNA-interacting partner isoform X1 [Canis lupus familiaris]|uniref:PCNA-interacting partner n=4 Tax=Canis lupus TaxID=9612 RepID=A0A8C0N4J4_CANLF|nr:PCNA-interacting partner isoform X1 [Canis lupus familiaris]XP_038544376.1 PCNA-interacting partner isoform X1 [Canis lupus familiaris]XP_855025.1 PCNA-interacting partner isoform X1 [Canis lupus familiaris]|eukprot:XP_855025.1 PCNA-interacting partner isoform X1 [Canis lupus familiaris]
MAALNQKSILDMIKEFRRNWHTLCNSERTTVCGADSMLLALQLSMAENNKQHSGEFTVSLSDVLLTWKYFLHEKLNLSVENMEVIDHYEDIKKTYDDFLKKSNMLDLIDVYKKCILISSCEYNANISPSQLRDFLSGRQYEVADETDLYVPTSPVSKHNQDNEKVQLLARKIIYSYLNLLVNLKNDLALAHILNIPDRGLGREAFTDLKHAAQEKKMSIFLVATSFIRTLELGGKGYAPSPSDPLRAHVKGLSNFINFIDKLDEILGEIPNPSIAGGRILSVIKMQLIKGQNSRDPFCKAVEEVAQDLDLRIKNIINSQQGDVAVSTTDISPARPKSYAINHGTAYCGRDTVKTLLVLLDEEAASMPTKNKAELLYDDENTVHNNGISILTLFRSPIQVKNSSMKSLRERICKSMQEKKIKMKQTLIRSQFTCTYKDDCTISKDKWNDINSASKPLSILHVENDFSEGVNSSVGRPTIGTSSGNVHLDRSKSEKVARKPSSQTGSKSSKRKQVDLDDKNNLCDYENEPAQHKNVKIPKTSNNFQNKLCGKIVGVAKNNKCTAKNKLITGQTKLTQFFRL